MIYQMMYKDTSTYFLMGLYMTKKAYKEDLSEIHSELQSRWNLPERKSEFDEYFSNWDLTPETFKLNEKLPVHFGTPKEPECPMCDAGIPKSPAFESAKKILEENTQKDTFDYFFE